MSRNNIQRKSQDDINFILLNYGKIPIKEIAKRVNTNVEALQKYASWLRRKKGYKIPSYPNKGHLIETNINIQISKPPSKPIKDNYAAEDLYNLDQVADILGCTKETVKLYVGQSQLAAIMAIPRESLKEFILKYTAELMDRKVDVVQLVEILRN